MNKKTLLFACCLASAHCFALPEKEVPLIPLNVLFGEPQKANAQLSPDGTKLAYLAPHNGVLNIWVKSFDKNNDVVMTNRTGRGIGSYFWTYDCTSLIYSYDVASGAEEHHLFKLDLLTKTEVDLTPGQKMTAGVLAYSHKHPDKLLIFKNTRDARYFDVYTLDLKTYQLELIEQNPGDVTHYVADNDLQIRGAVKQLPDASRQFFIRTHAHEPWQLLISWSHDDLYSGPVLFHKDGRTLYLVDSRDSNTAQLVKLDIPTGKKTVLARDDKYDIESAIIHHETHEPILVSFFKDRHETHALDPAFSADLAAMRALDSGDFYISSWTRDYSRCTVSFSKDTGSPCAYLYDRTTKKGTFLFTLQPELDKYTLAPIKPINLCARDGLTLHGYLTCPVNKQPKNLPLVLVVHGGPWARDYWGYDSVTQLLANRGYACLQINFRGSTGYGKKFLNACNQEWGRNMHHDLIDAVNWAIKEGIADKNRIAICGGSYGGYAALCGAAFTPDVFCCAVDLFGVCNILTLFKSMPPHWEQVKAKFKYHVGDPETQEAMLKERSPLFSAHKIKCPLLIIYGGKDIRCPPSEAQQILAALKHNNIQHESLCFENEGHGCVNPDNRIKLMMTAEKFLAQHLGGRCQ